MFTYAEKSPEVLQKETQVHLCKVSKVNWVLHSEGLQKYFALESMLWLYLGKIIFWLSVSCSQENIALWLPIPHIAWKNISIYYFKSYIFQFHYSFDSSFWNIKQPGQNIVPPLYNTYSFIDLFLPWFFFFFFKFCNLNFQSFFSSPNDRNVVMSNSLPPFWCGVICFWVEYFMQACSIGCAGDFFYLISQVP